MNKFKEKIKKMTPLECAGVFRAKHPEFFDNNRDLGNALEKANPQLVRKEDIEK